MRKTALILLALAGTAVAGEQQVYPLWNGHESVADYAKKVNLSPTKTLDLGNGVKLELVLIPAGRFMMGTPEPTPVDEDGFKKKIITGQVFLVLGSVVLLTLLALLVIKAIRKRQSPKYSLLWLLVMTVVVSIAVYGGVHWRESAQGLDGARVEFQAAKERFRLADDNEKPGHTVTLTKPYYMGKFVVTQEQYQAVMGQNPSQSLGKDNPMEQISWNKAQEFCTKLTENTLQVIRLPTEAEWEHACRAGTNTAYYCGDSEPDLARAAWYFKMNSNFFSMGIRPVGKKVPNKFGLYDMHGNVYQWCQDWFGNDYYTKSETENPQGPVTGTERVLRGGAFTAGPRECRSAYRARDDSVSRDDAVGFRVVVDAAFKTQ